MKTKTFLFLAVPIAALAGYAIYSSVGGGGSDASQGADMFTAKPGRLRVTVTESAELYASRSVDLRNRIEGRTAILWLIEEGTFVKKGDKVAELDISALTDREENQAIAVSRARAARITAEKGFEIQKNQNASDIESAQNAVLFAALELEKFMGKSWARKTGLRSTLAEASMFGDDPSNGDNAPHDNSESETNGHLANGTDTNGHAANGHGTKGSKKSDAESQEMGERDQQRVAAIADIEVAEAEVQRAKNQLVWTEKLHEFKYVTDNNLEADKLTLQKAENAETLARNKLYILENYTLRKTQRELEAKLKEAQAELQRTRLWCDAKLATQQAELDSKRQELALEEAKLDKYREQIKSGVLYAPGEGLVVYAKTGDRRRREPIDVGTEVREEQKIITLPDVSSMRIKSSIHEAHVDKVADALRQAQGAGKPGPTVTVKVDAFPDRVFFGRVTRVAVVPDSNQSWFNPDVKLYSTQIELVGDRSGLRPGQTVSVEIEVANLNDVLAIPIQAVHRSGRVLYVWKKQGSPTPVPVQTGIANDQFVVIPSGVEAGDEIFLSPPEGVEKPEFKNRNAQLEAAEKKSKKDAQSAAVATPADAMSAKSPSGPSAADGRRGEGRRGTGRRGEGRGERAGQGGRGRQGGGRSRMDPETRKRYTAFFEAAKKRFPTELADMKSAFSMMRKPELLKKVMADSTIRGEFADVIKRIKDMQKRFGGGAGRSRGRQGG